MYFVIWGLPWLGACQCGNPKPRSIQIGSVGYQLLEIPHHLRATTVYLLAWESNFGSSKHHWIMTNHEHLETSETSHSYYTFTKLIRCTSLFSKGQIVVNHPCHKFTCPWLLGLVRAGFEMRHKGSNEKRYCRYFSFRFVLLGFLVPNLALWCGVSLVFQFFVVDC